MIKLGQQVQCKLTRFQGVAVARTEWINGCARIMVQPPVDKDGKLLDMQQFDEPQLTVIGESNYPEKSAADTGGPAPIPTRTSI